MKIKTSTMALLTLILLLGSIFAADALGLWQTESTRVPARYAAGEAAGEYNPADIRGSFDLAAISTQFDIPAEDLMAAFSVPAGISPADFQLKDLETIWADITSETFEIGTSSVRLFVAAYKGLPLDLVEETGLPGAAVDILLAKGTPTEEQKAYITSHRVEKIPEVTAAVEEGTQAAVAKDESVPAESSGTANAESERKVNATTTWKDLEGWGVTQEEMEAAFGQKIAHLSMIIKDDCRTAGLRFSDVKGELQVLVDVVE